eukprot:TRINITY_DN94227_c0_g1_i1.p1 TRINITY_DN94227_c0_g1~~TRINITY_DN94227_c0_g1_i1.p1  ORF type:complete len:450 (+),score=60.46 TRINITY_DN94227_c0_g1_i1:49-1398(+)
MSTSKQHLGLNALAAANRNIICTAKRDSVRKISMRDVLATSHLRIPMFQRRYCWGPVQWNLLLGDAIAKLGHELGRLTLYELPNKADASRCELLVSDGQQRCTTSLLLLAAIRDDALELGVEGSKLAASLDDVLCADKAGLIAWRDSSGRNVASNNDLPFLALSPTYFDREAFYTALLPFDSAQFWTDRCSTGASSARPLEAKRHFRAELQLRLTLERKNQSEAVAFLSRVAEGVLSFSWLYFAISLQDSTEDATIIFQRMAFRDEMLRRHFAQRPDEGVNLGDSDFVRSLLLGSFRREEDAFGMYRQCWLTVEQKAEEIAKTSGELENTSRHLDVLLESFLAQHPKSKAPDAVPSFRTRGLYDNFKVWLRCVLTDGCKDPEAEELILSDAAEVERGTRQVLAQLCIFAQTYTGKSRNQVEACPQPTSAPAPGSMMPPLPGRRKRGLGT